MLILDVRMCWSLTHQMLHEHSNFYTMECHALDYHDAINSSMSRDQDLHAYELSKEDWTSITLVSSWLKSFRNATTQILLASIPPSIKCGLIDGHTKLSNYHHKFDESPFYTWAALLDPRISYQGMNLDYTAPPHSPQKIFMSHFHQKAKVVINELDKFFKLPQEDFKTCNPIHWWMGCCTQFSNLFWLAWDILCISVFSGGCDTISLQCASLQPETIKVLMLVKKRLHLAHAQCMAALSY
ncbi:hypothetical protein BJV74DRAFT_878162 [Russula compacta]|nr:hypothetical protein BJV74DRAFT_878162 [Russula compacta]